MWAIAGEFGLKSHELQTPIWTAYALDSCYETYCNGNLLFWPPNSNYTGCPEPHVPDTSECNTTIPGCKEREFDSIGNISTCDKCTNGLELFYEGSKCIQNDNNWAAFSDNTTYQCLSCYNASCHLVESLCIKVCSQYDTIDHECTVCNSGYYLYAGDWHTECPTGTQLDTTGSRCQANCNTTWEECVIYDSSPVCLHCNTTDCSLNCTQDRPYAKFLGAVEVK